VFGLLRRAAAMGEFEPRPPWARLIVSLIFSSSTFGLTGL
jgi:hypothetical protein